MRYFIEDNGRLISKITAIISMVLTIVNWVIILAGIKKQNGAIFFDGAFDCFFEQAYSGVCYIIAIVFMCISLLLFCLSYILNAMGAKKVFAIIFSVLAALAGVSLLLGMLSDSETVFFAFVGELSQLIALFTTSIGGIGLFIMGMIDSDHRGACLILFADILTVLIGWMIAIGIVLLVIIVITFVVGIKIFGGGDDKILVEIDQITGKSRRIR